MTPLLWLGTLLAVVYPWILPWMAAHGYASQYVPTKSHSVSRYIDGAAATGMMAVVSVVPLLLTIQYNAFARSTVP